MLSLLCNNISTAYPRSNVRTTPGLLSALRKRNLREVFDLVILGVTSKKKAPQVQSPAATQTDKRLGKKCCPGKIERLIYVFFHNISLTNRSN